MNPIPQQLETLIRQALSAAQNAGDLPPFDLPDSLPVSPPKNPDLADYASPAALALAKLAGKKPLDIAQAMQSHFPANPLIDSVEVAPPGFLNIRLSPDWLRAQVDPIIENGAAYFKQDIGAGRRAQVEFVSANPTGPLHVGRTRGAILGDTLANILSEVGWDVQREYYFNNAGRQMEILGRSLQARYLQALGQNVDLPAEGYQGPYLSDIAETLKAEVGAGWTNEDWPRFKEYVEAHIFALIKATLKRVNVIHDNFFNENSVYEDGSLDTTLKRLDKAGYVYKAAVRAGASEEEQLKAKRENAGQATWFKTTALGDEEDRVLVRGNGEPTYALPDIAYHINKLERGFDKAYNILGTDHIIEAQTVSRGLTALGYDASKVHVVLHQFITFKDREGNPVRMSTREGNYVTLDDLIDDVGADAVRYFILARSPNSHFEFDYDLAREQSNENPVYYIQNAHVRCWGIFRQLTERGLPENWDDGADLSLLGERELAFIRKALELPEQLMTAYERAEPHLIAFYASDLARLFHPTYDAVRVLGEGIEEADAKARLRFYRMARTVFAHLLGIMGMSAPEQM